LTALRQWFRTLPARYGRRTLIALALIAALGLVCRAVAVVHPVADPADDSHAYYALAKSLYEEGSYGGPEFKSEATSDWSPGAPWLYAGLFVVTGGPREGTIRILEALMGVGTILLVFLLRRSGNAATAPAEAASPGGCHRSTDQPTNQRGALRRGGRAKRLRL